MNILGRAFTIGVAAATVTLVVLLAVLFLSDGFRMRLHEVAGAARLAAIAGLIGAVLGPFSYASISTARSRFGAFFTGVVHSVLIYALVVFIAAAGNPEPTPSPLGRFLLYFALLFVHVGWATTLLGGVVALLIYASGGSGREGNRIVVRHR